MIDGLDEDFGLPTIELSDGDNEVTDTVDEAPEVNVDSIFGSVKQEENQAQPESKVDNGASAEGDAKPEETEKKTGEEVDFAQASNSAFFSVDGQLDSQKVSDYFTGSDKSFLAIQHDPMPTIDATKKQDEQIVDPEKEYSTALSTIASGWDGIVQDLVQNRGMTHEQAIQAIGSHIQQLQAKRDYQAQLAKDRENWHKEFRSELDEVRRQKVDAQIEKNITRLASQCDGLIPGVNGVNALNQFLLNKDFGGEFVDHLFHRDNPNFKSLPAEEQKQVVEKWFTDFKANGREMALVAEVGRLRWLNQRLPGIIEHAQKIGASKVGNARSTMRGTPSELLNTPDGSGEQSKVEAWLNSGFDSVN